MKITNSLKNKPKIENVIESVYVPDIERQVRALRILLGALARIKSDNGQAAQS